MTERTQWLVVSPSSKQAMEFHSEARARECLFKGELLFTRKSDESACWVFVEMGTNIFTILLDGEVS